MSVSDEYAEYRQSIKNVSDSLKPLRPPTAPASDIARARKSILNSSAPNFLLIQIALAIVVFTLLGYLLLPLNVAHGIAVLLLSSGIAVGIFLKK